MGIDPRALRTYLAVCREGSITGAAQQLNISQPAVSVTISQLEAALDTTLFKRSRGGIILTPSGTALKRHSEGLEALLKTAAEEVALAQVGVVGPFRIGGTPGALTCLVPRLVAGLRQQDMQFYMLVVEGTDAELIEMLRKGELDVAMATTGVESLPADIEEYPIMRDDFGLIVGRANDHLPQQISLQETSDLRWVLPEAAGAFRRKIEALFVVGGAPLPGEAIRCDSLLTTLAIIRTSNFVSIQPHGVATAELAMGTLRAIEITNIPVERNIGARILKADQHNATVQAILDALELSEG